MKITKDKIHKVLVIIVILIFIGVQANLEEKKRKVTIYIDNFTEQDLIILKNNKEWIKIKKTSSIIEKSLNTGTFVFTVKNKKNEILDTISVKLKNKKSYIFNLLGKMNYYEGYVSYSNYKFPIPGDNDEKKISHVFFSANASYIFMKPPSEVVVTKTNNSYIQPQYSMESRSYIRRENE